MISGEANSVNESMVSDWIKNLAECINGYTADCIFNAGETGLFIHQLAPWSYTAPGFNSHRLKKSKTRITVLLCASMGGKSLTAICCFSSAGLGPNRMVNGRVTGEVYRDFLRDYVLPYGDENLGGDYFTLHDNAPVHTAAVVSEFLVLHLPGRLIEHPPYSPDLNPIENLGSQFKRILKRYLCASVMTNTFEFETIARLAWREVGDNAELVSSLIQSIPTRYQSVIGVNGDHTKY